jgi:hypothetical protein
VAGGALAALHPLYYWVRLGVLTPQDLTEGFTFHVPSRPELGAVIWDPNLGLLWGFPLFVPVVVLVLALAARRLGRRTLTASVLAIGPMAAVFVVGVAQTGNFNHGGTFGMSRYAIWLIPLAVPVFERWRAAGRPWMPGVAVVVGASALQSIAVAHPRHADHHAGGPSAAARFLWERFPEFDNPLAEVFSERLGHFERVPVATGNCAKVLLIDGIAPDECPVPPAPEWCRRAGEDCYANRHDGGYRFASAPDGA